MRVISNKRLVALATDHSQADAPLQTWRKAIQGGRFASFADLKAAFASVDKVERFCVFNIGGNKISARCVSPLRPPETLYKAGDDPRGVRRLGTLSPKEASELAAHFSAVVAKVPLREITSETEYDAAVEVLDALLDAGGADETHPLADLVEALGKFIGDYDDRFYGSGAQETAA